MVLVDGFHNREAFVRPAPPPRELSGVAALPTRAVTKAGGHSSRKVLGVKPRRIENPELLEVIRELPCIACAAPAPSDAHHIKSRGAGGDDTVWNVISLCREHHSLAHQRGMQYMRLTFPSIRYWLEEAERQQAAR